MGYIVLLCNFPMKKNRSKRRKSRSGRKRLESKQSIWELVNDLIPDGKPKSRDWFYLFVSLFACTFFFYNLINDGVVITRAGSGVEADSVFASIYYVIILIPIIYVVFGACHIVKYLLRR